MKNSKYILLVIGLLGIIASIYGLIKGATFTDQILGFVCGTSLIYGYFELDKAGKRQ